MLYIDVYYSKWSLSRCIRWQTNKRDFKTPVDKELFLLGHYPLLLPDSVMWQIYDEIWT